MASSLFLNTPTSSKTKLHPVVLFSILDHYMRRPEGQTRVIGTLMGYKNPNGEVEIRNCFPVPHTETDEQVAVDMDFHKLSFELHRKVYAKEIIVGWYATGSSITEHSMLIHDFYGQEINSQGTKLQPIHLVVDTLLAGDSLSVKPYVSSILEIDGKTVGTQFQPVPLEMQTLEAEKIGLDLLHRGQARPDGITRMVSDLDNLELSIQKLYRLLESVSEYVENVQAGRTEPDTKIGRFLMDGITSVPQISMGDFDKMFDGALKDLLMVVYLSNLTRTQLALSEKLEKVVYASSS
jgi:translation initiation factor 3 subunit F